MSVKTFEPALVCGTDGGPYVRLHVFYTNGTSEYTVRHFGVCGGSYRTFGPLSFTSSSRDILGFVVNVGEGAANRDGTPLQRNPNV